MPRDQQGNVTRQKLEDVAARLFFERGFAGTSIREIAKKISIESATLYYYVDNKEDLLYSISTEALQEVAAAVKALMEEQLSPEETCRRFIYTHVTMMLRNRNKHAVMLLELRALSKKHQRKIVSLRDEYEALMQVLIERAQADGFLRKDIPAGVLKLLLLNLMNWSIFWYRPDGPLSEADIARYTTALFLEGGASGQES